MTGVVGLALARLLRELFERHYPDLAAGIELRKGRRPLLALGALVAWAAGLVFALTTVVDLLADGGPAPLLEVTQLAGLAVACAAAGLWLAGTWWRSTAP